MNLVFLKGSLPKRDLCVAETSAASARAEARGEQDERAARGELGEDEEKQVEEGQARARAFRGRAGARGELERNVAREDVDVDDPHEIDPVDLLHFHEHGDGEEGEGDEQEVDDGRLRGDHGGALRKYARARKRKTPVRGWGLKSLLINFVSVRTIKRVSSSHAGAARVDPPRISEIFEVY